jgi:hypothetical protein
MASNINRTKALWAVGIAIVIGLLDWFYMFYITSFTLQVKTQAIDVGGFMLLIPIEWLPILGVFLATLVGWFEVSDKIFPRRSGPEVDQLGYARLLRAVAFSVMTFVCVLYIPYLLGSEWFWVKVSRFGHSVPQLRDIGLSLFKTQEPAMTLDPLWQYSISQVLATAAMLLVAWAFSRTSRRPRKPR